MKFRMLILTGEAALLFALSVPAWGQSGPGASSMIMASPSSTQDNRGAAAMAQDVSRRIGQAWNEGRDASGAVAFQENGEIALNQGQEQQATQYFDRAERELDRIEAPASVRMTLVAYSATSVSESASMMDQEVSARIKQAWSEGKDASGAAAFQENGEIALNEGKEHEAQRFFQAALNELARLEAVPGSQAPYPR